jgi:hypothetical protein
MRSVAEVVAENMSLSSVAVYGAGQHVEASPGIRTACGAVKRT